MAHLSRKRPWLAAVLAALLTGLGHLYLRRWKRALGWLLTLFATAALLVPPAALEAYVGGSGDLLAVAPLLLVAALSTVDAYVLARAHNTVARLTHQQGEAPATCPHCSRALDADLAFCQWCASELDDTDSAATE